LIPIKQELIPLVNRPFKYTSGVTNIDQWSTSLVGYRATRFFTTALAALIESSNLVPSSNINTQQLWQQTTPASFRIYIV
jgi:hypothetical protein